MSLVCFLNTHLKTDHQCTTLEVLYTEKRIEHRNLIGQFISASHEYHMTSARPLSPFLPARAINTRSNYTRAGGERV